ncbi:MAG: YHS domain-containing protein [Rhizobiaceae bacterium]|nr:YHS domain-containing protein [Rhizobiaceae bacterium]
MKTLIRRLMPTLTLLTACLIFVALPQSSVLAKSPVAELNLSSSGLALRGIDPVSYFKSKKPIKGSKEITALHGGGTYRFASQQNKDTFLANPVKYLPAYGGFCSYGAASSYKVDGDPNVWSIVDGKLYLNINKSVDRSWDRRRDYYIRTADKIWPKISKK